MEEQKPKTYRSGLVGSGILRAQRVGVLQSARAQRRNWLQLKWGRNTHN
jgi:hypothetical protein